MSEALEQPAGAGVPYGPLEQQRRGEALRKESVEERAGKCPVTVLGHNTGTYYFLSPEGQLREVKASRMDKRHLRSVFGNHISWLWDAWPRTNPAGNVIGWNEDAASEWLIGRAHITGMFDPERKIRGTGVWRGEPRSGGDALVVHCGEDVLIDSEWRGAGVLHNGFIYPAYPSETRPAEQPATASQMRELLELYESWFWRSPAHAPRLLLGFTGCGVITGALRWRPHIQITGGPGTGKTTLDDLIKRQLGSIMLGVSAPTEAGIRQLLKGSARPVMVDEMEPDNMERARRVIELARLGSTDSQSPVPRGSADGRATQWPVRACFLFSAILHPKFRPQDLSRICVLDLDTLPTGIRDDGLLQQQWVAQRIDELGKLGPGLRRRMIDGFARFERNLLTYETAIAKLGARARVAKQLGTLLAAADTLLIDEPVSIEHADKFVADFAVPDLTGHEDEEDHVDCLTQILSSTIDGTFYDGRRTLTVSEMVVRSKGSEGSDYDKALRQHGLAIKPYLAAAVSVPCLIVANSHRGLDRLFEGTRWAEGGWRQALMRVPDAFPGGPCSFAGLKKRGVWIPLQSLPIEMSDDE